MPSISRLNQKPQAMDREPHPPQGRGWGASWANVPQLRGEKLRNGQTWCGPAVGTTLARMLGTHKDKRNETLFHELRQKHTTDAGTTPEGMVRMIHDVGGRVDGQVIAGAYRDDELNGIFNKGNKVVAQIGLRDEKTGEHAAHWVIVHGRDAKGNYTIKDPLRGEYTMKPEELREAVYRAPGLGGVLIPVTPGGSQRSSGPFDKDAFVDLCRPDGSSTGKSQNIPAGASAQQLADQVVSKLRSDDFDQRVAGLQRLDALERSALPAARKAYEMIMRLFGKQPGGGQRNGYNGFGD
jgi:hypothetical protein